MTIARVPQILAGTLGLMLAAAGGWLAIGEARLLPARVVVWDVAAERSTAAVAVSSALSLFDLSRGARPDILRDEVLLERRLVEDLRFSGEPAGRPLLADAPRHFERSMRTLAAAAPMPGRAWCDLGALAEGRAADAGRAAQMLDLCLDAAPANLAMVRVRWRLGFKLWPYLQPSTREKLLGDVTAVLSEPRATIWDVELIADIVGRNAPRQANLVRARIVARRKDLLDIYDGAFLNARKSTTAEGQ